jgi:hypothetical protein
MSTNTNSGMQFFTESPLAKRSRTASKELGDRYDKLASLWEQAEALLRATRLSRPVHVEFPDPTVSEDHTIPCTFCLGLHREKGKWAICYAQYDAFDKDQPDWDGPRGWKLLSEAPAETRLRVWKHFEKLYEKVVETAEETVGDYDNAIDEFGDVLAKLK